MTDLTFSEVRGEVQRIYVFPDGQRFSVLGVVRICVRPSGTHRLETGDGTKFIVPTGWLAIEIYAPEWSL